MERLADKPVWRDPVDFYRTHAARFDAERSRSFFERDWLGAFAALLPPGGTVLDLGCGMGEPIAAALLERGFRVTGVDSTPAFLELARARFPAGEWIEADMRSLDLGRRFDGILGWDSFFHLSAEAQRECMGTFGRHASPNAALMFNTGGDHGEAINPCFGELLYHASLSPDEYRALLAAQGFHVVRHAAEDQACGGRTIWLARRDDNGDI